MFNKKAELATAIVVLVIIVVILIFFGWIINLGNKECLSDRDCGSDQYCTYSNACKDTPVIEKIQYVEKPTFGKTANYNFAIIFLGISLVGAALIMKWNFVFGKGVKQREVRQKPMPRKPKSVDWSKNKYRAEEEGMYDEYLDYEEW